MSGRASTRTKKPPSRLSQTVNASAESPVAESSSAGGSRRRSAKVEQQEEPPTLPSRRGKGKEPAGASKTGKAVSKRGKRGGVVEVEQEEAKEEKEEEEEEDEEDENKAYCLCKKPAQGKMIECENCKDWFHFKCIKMSAPQAEMISQYFCPSCIEASDGVLKTRRTTDVTLLPSPTPSTSADPEPKPSKSKGKSKVTSVEKDARPGPKSKAKGSRGRASKKTEEEQEDVEMDGSPARDEADEKEKERFRSTPSDKESSDGHSTGDDGSEYGDGSDVQKKKKRKGAEESEVEGDSDGSSEGAPEKPDLAISDDTKTSANKKRKSSGGGSSKPPSKMRKVSSSQAKPTDSPAPATEYTEWTPMRSFCLKKLEEALVMVIIQFRRSRGEGGLSSKDSGLGEVAEQSVGAEDLPVASSSDAMDVDVPTPAENVPFDEDQTRADAMVYAKALEASLYARLKEPDPKQKGKSHAGKSYKNQYQLVASSLEKDLRPDLAEGISTGSIPPETLAAMDSKGLATTVTLEQINKAEAESLKGMVRLEDANAPLKYTKKAMEDPETLQQIEKAVQRQSEGRRPSQHVPEEPVVEEPAGMDIVSDNTTPRMQSEGFAPDASNDMIAVGESPSSKHLPTLASRESFSLSASLHDNPNGEQKPAEMRDGHGDVAYEELPDFTGATPLEEVASDAGMADMDYFTGEKTGLPEGSVGRVLSELPVVWTGEILNPAQPDSPSPLVEARQVGGSPQGTDRDIWKAMFRSSPVELVGRVTLEASLKYLAGSRFAASKETYLVAFTPGGAGTKDEEDQKKRLKTLFDFHIGRGRHGVMKPYGSETPPPGCPQEIYLVPMRPDDRFDFFDTMDKLLLPKERDQDVLIGVFICLKQKEIQPKQAERSGSTPAAASQVVPSVPPPASVSASASSLPGLSSSAPSPLDVGALLKGINYDALKAVQLPPMPSPTTSYSGQGTNLPGLSTFAPPPPIQSQAYNPGPPYPAYNSPAPNMHVRTSSQGTPSAMPPFVGSLPVATPPAVSSGYAMSPPGQHNQSLMGAGRSPPVRHTPPVHPSRLALVNSPPRQNQAQFNNNNNQYAQPTRPMYPSPGGYMQPQQPPPQGYQGMPNTGGPQSPSRGFGYGHEGARQRGGYGGGGSGRQ